MKRITALLALLIVVLAAAGAEESRFSIAPAPRFWGATVFGRYSIDPPAPDQVETSVIAGLSAAYETEGYYRSPDGSLFTGGDAGFSAESADYDRFDMYWQLGVQQGILPRSDVPEDLAVVFAYYRGRYDRPRRDDSQLYFSSGLPEVDGGLLGSVHAGLAFSNVAEQLSTVTKQGAQSELVVQWGPSFLHNNSLGSANFTRTTLSGRYFLPLYRRAGDNGLNLFSVYLAAFAAVDWATGPDVPMAVRSTFGTRSERPGLGGSVRGFESGRFDATLKAVTNVELRANLPEIPLAPDVIRLIPGILVYTDAGYFNDLDAFSPVPEDQTGTLFSSGAGLYLDAHGIAEVIFYTNLLWDPSAVDGAMWVPFTLGFGFHY